MELAKRLAQGAVISAAVLSIAWLSGCGSERDQNSEIKPQRDVGPAEVINFPQGFRNVAHKCDGPNMVYVTSRGDVSSSGSHGSELPSSVYVIANDPRCNK